MSFFVKAYSGAIEGFRNFTESNEKLEGNLAIYNKGVSKMLFLAGTILPIVMDNISYADNNRIQITCAFFATTFGLLKGTNGGIDFFGDAVDSRMALINGLFNCLITLNGIANISISVCPLVANITPLNGGIITLGLGCAAAVGGNALKQMIDR